MKAADKIIEQMKAGDIICTNTLWNLRATIGRKGGHFTNLRWDTFEKVRAMGVLERMGDGYRSNIYKLKS